MKYFRLEPTFKQSVIESTSFKQPLSNFTEDDVGDLPATLIKETGWRWGDFIIGVPQTEEEIAEWLESSNRGYDNFYDLAVDCCLTETDKETGKEVLPSDRTVQELLEMILLPNLDDDHIMITEDYPEAEMNNTSDGCWDEWSINTHCDTELEDIDVMIEDVKEAYYEDHEEGVEQLGWAFQSCEYEMQCKPMLTPINEHGEEIGEPMKSEDA